MIDVEKAIKKLQKADAWLTPHLEDIRSHLSRYNGKYAELTQGGALTDAANAHLYFGFHRVDGGWVFREWLPEADAVYLIGDFNGWNHGSHPLTKGDSGIWSISLAGENALCHGQYVKLWVVKNGEGFERIPAYIRYTEQDKGTGKLCGRIWAPESPYPWTDEKFHKKKRPKAPLIYEAHIGMAQEKYDVGTYREFADITLPRIQKAGYNTVQLMAVQQHPYYASFGYQVTNFFAPAHWFGEPEDLKYLINKAHGMGITVLLDVVHSHSCPNVGEGLNMLDGAEGQYFLTGERGWHSAWGTCLFNYGRIEVLQFLLSNLKYWIEEFHFDGFRFDGVTSMLYENHGLGVAFTSYAQYFSLNTNVDARVYLMLANALIHALNPKAITIAEDMSGMPGACLPIQSAGFGFDYRLAMGVPDMWIKLLKEVPMENWNVFYLWHELTGGREKEKAVGYAESHDQAMVGDKTVMFRLADAEMYTGMCKDYHSPVMDTAVDMHKLIRFLTLCTARDGYLNFMGNEFGHPEWIDFPREGNGWSFHHARRQWSLVENGLLKYEWLNNFDRAMIAFAKKYGLLTKNHANSLWLDDSKKEILFERDGLLFAFNMHPTWSQERTFVSCQNTGAGKYRVVMTTDAEEFGGYNRVDASYEYVAQETEYGLGFFTYLPCRTAVVFGKVEE